MSDARLVIHGHFYQPPRENPWTDDVAVEPSAAPYHDWNARITAECYRPNGWARVLNGDGRVTDIVDNYEHLSFNVGPTLLSWLEAHEPAVGARMREADRVGGGAIAQAYNHMILPLANDRDRRTQVRWGLADFRYRFGRDALGLWLPETAVNDDVLCVLVEEGVRFTILAPDQADGSIVSGHPYRWMHPDGSGRSITLLFYDGAISHDLAFGLTGMSSQELVRRVRDAAADGRPVLVATDGETFGHHHKFAERAIAYVFSDEAAASDVQVLSANALVDELPPIGDIGVRESAWSCVHGVARWRDDCGCSTGGQPGWNQRWRAPLRAALDLLRGHGIEVFERRGGEVLHDPWAARDAYIEVVLGAQSIDDFLRAHARVDEIVALTLLEAQRQAMLMYTSCGWFFNDLAGIETIQVLRYAARLIDLLSDIDEADGLLERFLGVLADAHSNDPDEGDGPAIWHRHVDPSRVDAGRVVGHLALVSLLEDADPPPSLAGYDVIDHQRQRAGRGPISGVAGRIRLRHRRTRRVVDQVYAAIHVGGLEVYGATRAADPTRDSDAFSALASAVGSGQGFAQLVRVIGDRFGPREFGLESALPDAADQIVAGAADALAARFRTTFDQLYSDHRSQLDALVTAGYPLPRELRAPAELALADRLEAEIAAAVAAPGNGAFTGAHDIAREARRAGLRLATPRATATLSRALLAAVDAAAATPNEDAPARAAIDVLRIARDLGVSVDLERPQERAFDVLRTNGHGRAFASLAAALGLRVQPGTF